jgi:hypothetical protein
MGSKSHIEAQKTQRVTTDIDILADARARPSGTTWATGRLKALGASLRDPQEPELERGFRFDFDGQIVDVLAPDGLGPSGATTTGKLKTIQIPGGTQALARTASAPSRPRRQGRGPGMPRKLNAWLSRLACTNQHSPVISPSKSSITASVTCSTGMIGRP